MKKSVLVSGAAGFIGSYLCKRLSAMDYDVVAVDNLINNTDERFYKLNPSLTLANEDINTINAKIFLEKEFIYFFDLAYINGTANFYSRGVDILTLAGKTIFNNMQLANQLNCRFIYFSTPEAYGFPETFPTNELEPLKVMDIRNPRWSYAIGKIFSESAIFSNYEAGNLNNFVIVRPNNAYGPFDKGHVIPDIIEKIRNNSDYLDVEGSPDDSRCYCFIEDMIDQLMNVAAFGKHTHIYNLGNSKEINISYLLKAIFEVFNVNPEINYKSRKAGSPLRRVPDPSAVNSLSKNIVYTDLHDGLKTFLDYDEYRF